MGTNGDFRALPLSELRAEIEELFAEYDNALNKGEYEAWADLFIEDGLYRVIPRDNFEMELPIAAWHCESRGMLLDRIVAIRKTAMYAPRYIRRFGSGIVVRGWEGAVLRVESSYIATETLLDEMTRLFNTGQRYDEIVVEDSRLKFKSRVCVFDSLLVPNSLVLPI